MNYVDAFNQVWDKNALLIVGSGFSYGSENILKKSPPSGVALTETLKRHLGTTDDIKLDEAAEDFISEFSETELIQILKENFQIVNVADWHKKILSAPWHRVYTTNYDTVVEISAAHNGKTYTSVTSTDSIRKIVEKNNVCIHLNGSIERLDYETLNSEFKLTKNSYLNANFIDSEFTEQLKIDLINCDAIFIVGFSIQSDFEIHKMIHTIPEIQSKCFIICAPNENSRNLKNFNKIGQTQIIGVENFSLDLMKSKESYVPRVFPEKLKAFSKFEIPNDLELKAATQDKVFDLLFKGDLDNRLLCSQLIRDKSDYTILRNELSTIHTLIERGNKLIFVHSDLGNGKSILIKQLGFLLTLHDIVVYSLSGKSVKIQKEITRISENNPSKKIVLIIEDYHHYFDELKSIKSYITPNMHFILTDRTIYNDLNMDRVISDFKITEKEISIVPIHKLKTPDIIKLDTLLLGNGFFGDLSGASDEKRIEFLSSTCFGQFNNILLELLQSDNIRYKLNDLLQIIENRSNTEYLNLFLFALVLDTVQFKLPLYSILELLDSNNLYHDYKLTKNVAFNQICDFKHDTFRIKSSILAKYLIQVFDDADEILRLMVRVMKKADGLRINKSYFELMKTLVNNNTIGLIIGSGTEQNLEYIDFYYDKLRKLEFNERNAYFWLQYAIAKLNNASTINSFENVKTLFDNAYGLKTKGKGRLNASDDETYQIDNHYARYLLSSHLKFGNSNDAIDILSQAHSLNFKSKNNNNNNRHYPYRVARSYVKFYDKYYDDFNANEKASYKKIIEDVLRHLNKYKKNLFSDNPHIDVMRCEEEIKSILDQLN